MADQKIHLVYLMRKMVGGMQTHLIDLLSGLDRDKYRLSVISPNNPSLSAKLSKMSIPLIDVEIDEKLNPLKDWMTIRRLRGVLSEIEPDILHIHGNKTALVGRFAIRGMNIPAVIVTVHNFLVFQESNSLLKNIASWTERRLAKDTDTLITVSSSLKKSLVEIEGIPAEKIVTIPNGIDIDRWKNLAIDGSFREKIGIKKNEFMIANVGRLVSFKGHQVLIEAAAKVKDEEENVKVVIAGDGPLKEQLMSEVKRLELEDTVYLLGFVDDNKQLMAEADLFVLPSIKEPFGIVVLEAMAAGLPVLATRAGGVPDIVTEGDGILVPPNDAEALAQMIIRLKNDSALRKALSTNGLRRVSEEFSASTMVERTVKVYDSCFERKSIA